MDVFCSRLFRLILLPLIVLITGGCDNDSSEVRQKLLADDETCAGESMGGRYIVKWNDGRITTVTSANDDAFVETFLTDNFDQVEYAERDRWIKLMPDNSFRPFGTSEPDNWGVVSVNAPDVWSQGIRGSGVVVAIIDTGVDTNHWQLANRIFTNDGEVGTDINGDDKRTNGVDDDGNGYVDDYAGYDFVVNSPHVYDWNGHGTHVAGIIAAEHNETTRVKGVVQGIAPGAEILPITFIGQFGGGYVTDAIEAIDFAVVSGANVINASWGGPGCSKALEDRIALLYNEGVLFVAAAGNSSSNLDVFPEYPAAYRLHSQITVGSITRYGGMAFHSNYSDHLVDLFAPGTEIFSTLPNDDAGTSSGTSMATPFVSGALALLWSQRPEASAGEIKNYILSNTSVNPSYRNVSQGTLNVSKAMTAMALQNTSTTAAQQ